jgi:hypothetical protein
VAGVGPRHALPGQRSQARARAPREATPRPAHRQPPADQRLLVVRSREGSKDNRLRGHGLPCEVANRSTDPGRSESSPSAWAIRDLTQQFAASPEAPLVASGEMLSAKRVGRPAAVLREGDTPADAFPRERPSSSLHADEQSRRRCCLPRMQERRGGGSHADERSLLVHSGCLTLELARRSQPGESERAGIGIGIEQPDRRRTRLCSTARRLRRTWLCQARPCSSTQRERSRKRLRAVVADSSCAARRSC